MDEAARVLELCAATPDDDGPRLVWADLVGGERGELVVLQCDLARGNLTPREFAKRRAREKQILDAHTVEWAGELATIASRWSFRRGFIEAARIDPKKFEPSKVAAHPLLRSVLVESWNPPIDKLDALTSAIKPRGFGLVGGHNERAPLLQHMDLTKLRGLSAFAIERAEARDVAVLTSILSSAPIEQLWLRSHALESKQVEALLEAAPRPSALELTSVTRVDNAGNLIRHGLHALKTGVMTFVELRSLAKACPDLERLTFTVFGDVARAIDALASFPKLRTLDISSIKTDEPNIIAQELVRSVHFVSLRDLRIYGATTVPLQPVMERFGSQLERFHLPYEVQIDTSAVAGEVYIPEHITYSAPLLHHDPATMLALGAPSFPRMAPASIARLDIQGPIWDIPAMPAEDSVFFGRSMDVMVRLNSPMVARRHARLLWRDGHHVLEDLASTNGVHVGDERIQEHVLSEGDEFRVAEVLLQYFVGEGARQRAEEAVAAASSIDPNTRLYRHDSPAVRVDVRDWEALVRRYGRSLADYIMRVLAQDLERDLPDEKLWLVHQGCFGVETREVADRVVRSRTIDLGHTSIEVHLEVR